MSEAITSEATTTGTVGIKSRGTVTIDIEHCKGCDLCIPACPPGVLAMSTAVNHMGYRYPRALRGLHRLRRVPLRVSRLRVRGLPLRTTRRHRSLRSATMTPTTRSATTERVLMEGSEALARAAIAAGCRFFAGYPMTPFTEVLEHFARLLPDVGGVCINAESELEAVGMAWGALSTGARAATGFDRSGALADAGVVLRDHARRAPARHLQHGAWSAGLLPGDAGRRSRRLPTHRARAARRARGSRARAARVPPRRQVAQPGAGVRRLPARAHPGGDLDRIRRVPGASEEGLGGRRLALGQRAAAAPSHRSA